MHLSIHLTTSMIMKKFFLTIAIALFLIFCSNGTYAQTLPKGCVIGLHDAPVTLSTGVTMEQYESFVKNKLLPGYEKNFPGTKCFLLKGKRGQCTDCYAFIMTFPSDAVRDKFWKADNTYTEAGQKAFDAMKTLLDEWNKLGTFTDRYTDWIVQ
jgi:hypothetical protein